MEQLNKTPITGKFGDVAKVLDTNFGLIVTKLMELSKSKKMNCGFYSSETELKTAYPNPDKGMVAYVGSGTDYTVYRCKTDGTWTATSETFKVTVDLSTYATKDALAQVKGSVDSLLLGAVYGGIAARTTNPGTPNVKVFYLPTEVGEYPNFGNLSVVENEIAFLYYDGTNWTKQSIDFSNDFNDKLSDLNNELAKKFDKESIVQVSGYSEKLVMSQNAVSTKLSDLEKKIGDRFVVEGDVTNLPDEEDLTSVKESERNVLKFADKRYAPENFSGKGYKRLRKNIQKINLAVTKITVNSAPTKDGEISVTINNINTHISLVKDVHNTPALVAQTISDTLVSVHKDYDIEVTENIITLTHKHSGEVAASAFDIADTETTLTIEDSVKSVNRNIIVADMISNPNTIYEIRYDFDFENKTITLPENSILCFEGGSFSNVTLKGSNTTIQAQNYEIFKNVTLTGVWDTADFYVEWFGAKGDGVNDDTTSIQKALDVVLSVTLPFHITVHLSKTYRITDTLNIHAETTLKGNFIGSYMNYAKTQYKCIVADFSDTKKWIVQSSNLKNSAYNANLGKNPVDSGTIKYQEAIRIEDIKIESSNTNNPAFGGIRIIASSNSSIKNCSVFHPL
uniref:glycosyl hydrolase family 28-related protein n=1 Tax=Segatella hominis TaxID=2518605 RepID=UPI0040297F36